MRKVIALLIILLCSLITFAQTRSYVQEDAPKISGIKTNGALDSLSQADKQTSRTYFDGLGRPIQSVAVQASPAQKDMVQPVAYNALGQQTISYLPYVSTATNGAYHSAAIADQKTFYQVTTDKIAVDTSAYSQQVFENSPLARVLREGIVGTGFQPVTGQHYKTVTYRSNTTGDNVLQWAVDGTTLPAYYAANVLSVTDATDEQGIKTLVFTNKYGQTVLKRQMQGSGYLDTYYIYNIAGLVSYVVPPKADSLMKTRSNYSLTQSGVNKLLFKYGYDDLGRVIEKTVPAASELYIVYDPLNRPVLVQDGNLRSLHRWNYIKYDMEGRAISQGIYADPSILTRADMQYYVTNLSGYNTTWAEVRNTTSADGYYTNNVFPTTNIEPLAYSYFDDYDLDGNGTPDYAYANQSLPGEGSATNNTHSLLTMLRKRTLGSGLANIWLTSAYFYDGKEQLIQTQGNNQLNGTVADVSTTVLNFISKPTVSLVKKVTSATTTVKTTYNYDTMFRLTTLDQQYNSDPTVRVANYVYNEIGQLVKKNLHAINGTAALPTDLTLRSAQSVSSGQDVLKVASNSITLDTNFVAASGSNFVAKIVSNPYLQSVDYRYNIRGQMLSINNSTLTVNSINDDADDVFGMEMSYNETPVGLGNTASWNGQLTAVRWMSRDGAGNKGNERNYNYSYDQLNRLTSAMYQDRPNTGGSWSGNGAFDEKDIRYDVNGNIMALKRNALLSGTVSAIDNLTYTYDANNPNRLKHMTDGTGANYTGYGFRNLTGSTGDYDYDDNGNLTTDPYKGLSFTYNALNRPDVITVTTGTGKYINYTYSGDGILLRKQQYNSSTLQKTTDYIDGFVYENTTLAYFGTPEGRVLYTGGKLQPQYIITDQQGNARVTFVNDGGTAKVIQENSYYAFGLIMPGGITPGTNPNKNLYNGGSEWQDDFGDLLDLMQTYYRNYDQALGRWTGVDPNAEDAESLTTYNYSGNNPVMFNDPLGNLMTGNPGSDRHEAWLNANSAFNPDGTIKTGVDRELENWLSGGGGSKASGDYSDFWEDVVNNANQKNSNIVTYTSADLNHIFLGDYSVLLPEININGPLPSWWGDSQLFLNARKTLFGRTVIANQIGVGQPGFGESLIPVWGSGRAAIDDFQNGRYGWGAFNTALAISDVFLVKAAVTAIVKGSISLAAREGGHLVYQGLDATGTVKYVGITGRDAAMRFGEHFNSGTAKSLLRYEVIDGAIGLSKTEARVWEQTLINRYGLEKNGGSLLNKINSISPNTWWQYGIK